MLLRPRQSSEVIVNLGKLAEFLNKHPERTAAIEGHTDNIGNDSFNQALSQRRADAVKSYLVAREGISSFRLTASGKGESSPIADNATSKGRQQNRRVEVIIPEAPATREDQQAGRKFRVEKQPVETATSGDR
jgi:outer membrane protein OmpA-like peptidoglycan-associated protein